jgi:short-subunit dehydrogenase
VPEIIKSGGGSVINMTSWRATMGGPSSHIYISAKGAIIH